MKASAFSFCHNCLIGGLPLVEAVEAVRPYVDDIVIVDLESTDQTPLLLNRLGVRVIKSPWGWPWPGNPRDTLNHAFEFHTECRHDTIIFFEADEVFDDRLLRRVSEEVGQGHNNLAVWRLQLEANFQRTRWYPIPVHRIFPKGKGSYVQHPTNCCPDETNVLPPSAGFLWDCSNNFRDNWFGRKQIQSELWGEPRPLMVPEHFTHPVEISRVEEEVRLGEAHWLWTETPFAVPQILRPLVGVTDYAHSGRVKALLEGEQ